MNRKTKIIAMYLPQFHCIPENDKFWGEGFTDWVSVKKAKPLFNGHYQPRIPLSNNYYDLSVKENVAWQAKIAKEYGIYGFGIYHYWFNNEKNILTKPVEIIRDNKNIDINYCFAWDNNCWKRSWSNIKGGNDWAPAFDEQKGRDNGPEILIPYILGTEADWKNHYMYLRSYFVDHRYIKKDNKPIFMILHYNSDIGRMCEYWDELAKKDGFDGIFFIFRYDKNEKKPQTEYVFKYEPSYSTWVSNSFSDKMLIKIKQILKIEGGLKKFNYDKSWANLLRNARLMKNEHIYHTAFVSYDDTPRRGFDGKLVEGASPRRFEEYLSELLKISEEQKKDFIFLIAWNEWGEGAYLEPDSVSKFDYLEAVKRALE